MSLREEAQARTREGYRVHPGAGNRKPHLADYPKHATTDEATIYEWWEHKYPNAEIYGVVGDDEIILDEDPRNGGDISIDELTTTYGPLPDDTPTTFTRRKGKHKRYKLPAGVSIVGQYTIAPGVDILGKGSNVVLAGTPGYEYEIGNSFDDVPIAEAPQWLVNLVLAEQAKRRQKKAFLRLPETIHKGTRNDTLFRFLCCLRSRGADDDEIADKAEDINQTRCKPPLTAKETDTLVRSVCEYQVGNARSWQEIEAARAKIATIRNAVFATKWAGKSGATQSALLLAILELAYDHGTLTVSFSVRQIGKRARVGGVTDTSGRSYCRISYHLHSLVEWLTRLSVGRGPVSSIYCLHLPMHATNGLTLIPAPSNVSLNVASHDVWGWQGLGKNAEIVWNSLSDVEVSANELSKQLSVSKRTVERQLAKLQSHELAIRGDKGWHRGPGTLDDAAARLGVLGYGDKLEEKSQGERAEYRKNFPSHFDDDTTSASTKETNDTSRPLKMVSKFDHSVIEEPPSPKAEEMPGPVDVTVDDRLVKLGLGEWDSSIGSGTLRQAASYRAYRRKSGKKTINTAKR